MNLETPIEKISRIPAPYQKRLKRLGINTVQDLIFHFPHRYEDFSNLAPIGKVKLNEMVCLQGKILEIENKRTWVKKINITEAVVEDKSGAIKAVWFNQPFLLNVLKTNDQVCLAGKILLKNGEAYLSNPIYEKVSQKEPLHTRRIVPVYPETEGLSSRWLRYILKPLLAQLESKIPENLPLEIIEKEKFLPIGKAIEQIHFPDSLDLAEEARKRFSFQELFLLQLLVVGRKIKTIKETGLAIPLDLEVVKNFVGSLPFELTDAQKKAGWQILKDMENPRPMSRLLQGDVGSGKTVVAALVSLNTAQAGFQVAFMAPTEILAKQHFGEICRRLGDFNLEIGLLTAKEAKLFKPENKEVFKIAKKELLEKIKRGGPDILIGTHALISSSRKTVQKEQPGLKFKNLALVIVDEQHRFGVEQRLKLLGQTQSPLPHFLSMTATPIPRSLALTIYGDLDLSLIDQMPKGRKKVITKIVPPDKRKNAYHFIKQEVEKGRQVFVICPRIEPSAAFEKNLKSGGGWDEVKAVKKEYQKLSQEVFPDLKMEMLHSRIKPEKKEEIMNGLRNNEINILVSTSVVEVGIDIPNATVMMIEGAERFGLAQLHQFRGRVGREKHQSHCFLFADSTNKKTLQRLKALVTCQNGLELAEKDLKIRGPGDFLGKRQSGIPDLAMEALKNVRLVEKTRNWARQILTKDLELKKYPLLKKRLQTFTGKIHLE